MLKRALVFFFAPIVAFGQKDLNANYPAAIDSFRQLIPHATDSARALLWFHLAFEYKTYSGDSTLKYAFLAAEAMEKGNWNLASWQGRNYSLIGAQLKNRGEYESSLKYHLLGLSASEKSNDVRNLAVHHNDLGVLLKQMKRYKEAMDHYRVSNEICDTIGLYGGYCLTLSNIGTCYDGLGMTDSARYFYQLSYSASLAKEFQNGIVTAASNLGELLCKEGKYQEALPFLRKALEIDEATQNRFGIMLSCMNLGNALIDLKQYREGLVHLRRADTLSASLKARHERFELFRSFSRYHERTGDLTKALEYHKKFSDLRDSVFAEDSEEALAEMRTRYETEKKERENLVLKNQNQKQEAQLEWERNKHLALTVLLIVILLLSILVLRNFRLKQKAALAQQNIEQQQLRFNAVIEAEEKERVRIAKDLHDGLGQLLSTAKLNVASLEGDVAVEDEVLVKNSMDLIDQSIREVRNISHNLMPSALVELGLVPALNDLFKKINDSKLMQVDFVLKNFNNRLNHSTEIALYRIIQEVVNNMIKHSKADKISVQLEKIGDRVKLKMEDNGIGFNRDEISHTSGIGWKNIFTRISMINGSIDVDTKPGKGTVINIDLGL